MSRAFVKEDDGEQGNAISEIQRREGKIEWLNIQEKKLARLLEASEKGGYVENSVASVGKDCIHRTPMFY